jgi:hypothetical protein
MINRDLVREARQTDLVSFLESNNYYTFKRFGKSFRCNEHDSLVITDNAYYWNSKSDSGNAIDFLTRHLDMDFKTALSSLLNTQKSSLQTPTPAKNPDTFAPDKDIKRVYAFLNQKRFIDNAIITEFIKKGLIKVLLNAQGYPNMAFPMKNESNDTVGYELHGLTDKRFKGISCNNAYGYGFSMQTCDANPAAVYFFESAIDLMSYYELYKPSGALLVSCAGVKVNIVRDTLKRFINAPDAFIAFDNDVAGHNAFDELRIDNNALKRIVPDEGKDWNDYLVFYKQSSAG